VGNQRVSERLARRTFNVPVGPPFVMERGLRALDKASAAPMFERTWLEFVPAPPGLGGSYYAVRTSSDPLAIAGAVRNEVLAIDSDQPIYAVKTLAQRVNEVSAVSRSLMLLFSAFALLALILGAVGIYGIVSYSVTQRTHEIGIRMALGARPTDVLKLTLRNGIALTVLGIVIGVGAAVALTRFMESMLFGVTPTDKLTFIAVSSLLFLVALCASLIPARRATKVDPLVALRYE